MQQAARGDDHGIVAEACCFRGGFATGCQRRSSRREWAGRLRRVFPDDAAGLNSVPRDAGVPGQPLPELTGTTAKGGFGQVADMTAVAWCRWDL
jgi:hypothetical protein